MRIAKRVSIPAIFVLSAFFLRPASAQTQVLIAAVPTSWLIQNYVPNQVVLWFTGSPCSNGQLTFPSTAVQADQDRLWAMIMTAKATGQTVYLYYINVDGGCIIQSFGLPD
jgi:hypothetical protein